MERFEDLIRRMVREFNDAEIDYMLTGSLAASYYGVPRTTVDIDFVVRVTREGLQSLHSKSYWVNIEVMKTALSDYL